MKKTKLYLLISLLAFLLNGCFAAFVPYTSDPLEMTENALLLTARERPLAARRILIYAQDKIDKSDINMMANFYRANAYMISSNEYQEHRSSRPDWNTDIDGNLLQSEKLYLDAIELFIKIESNYDASNTFWLLSKLYKKIGKHNEQCNAISNSKKYHFIGKSKDIKQGKDVIVEDKKISFDMFLDDLAKESNCKNIL